VSCSAFGCQLAHNQLCVKQDGVWTCGLCWEQHAGLVASVSGGFVEHLGTDCSAQSAAEDPLTAIIAHKALHSLLSLRASIHGLTTGLARKLLKPTDPTDFSVVCVQCSTSQRDPDGRCAKCSAVDPGQHVSQWSAKTTISDAAEASMQMENVGSPAASPAAGHTVAASSPTSTEPLSQAGAAASPNDSGRMPVEEAQLRVDPGVPNVNEIESAYADGPPSKPTSAVASAADGTVAARRTATAGSETERKRVRPPPTSPASSTSSAVKEAKKPAFAQPPTPAGKSAGQPLNLTSPRPEARGGGQLSPSGKRGQH